MIEETPSLSCSKAGLLDHHEVVVDRSVLCDPTPSQLRYRTELHEIQHYFSHRNEPHGAE